MRPQSDAGKSSSAAGAGDVEIHVTREEYAQIQQLMAACITPQGELDDERMKAGMREILGDRYPTPGTPGERRVIVD